MGGAGLFAVSFYASRRVALMASRRLARIPRVPRRVDVRRTNPPPRRRRAPHATPDAGDRQPEVRQGAGLRPLVAAEGRQPRLQGQVAVWKSTSASGAPFLSDDAAVLIRRAGVASMA